MSDLIVVQSRNPEMQQVWDMARQAATSNASILITGETGTGKEVLARDIHAKSKRQTGPFLTVNCGALAETLLETELFGHERGSFTGAIGRHMGVFEQAEGGTLFLDEIGDITPALQVKLLRVLQERELRRVGGRVTVRVNVRMLFATNRVLRHLVAQGRFRQDLYYRINVVALHVLPLRERREDISALVDHFVVVANQEHDRSVREISTAAMDALTRYSWPGNIRELANIVERTVVLARKEVVDVGDLPDDILDNPAANNIPGRLPQVLPADGFDLVRAMERYETEMIGQAMQRTSGSKVRAARLLGMKRTTLHEKVARRARAA